MLQPCNLVGYHCLSAHKESDDCGEFLMGCIGINFNLKSLQLHVIRSWNHLVYSSKATCSGLQWWWRYLDLKYGYFSAGLEFVENRTNFCHIIDLQYSIRHVKETKIKTIPPAIFEPPTSTRNCTMTENVPPQWDTGKHLSDVDIGKILGLAKASMPQQTIANLMKCGKTAVQNVLGTYVFETFQGRNSRHDRPWKTTQREDRYIERALKQNSFQFSSPCRHYQ